VILLAGLQLRYILGLGTLVVAGVPVAWHFMHDYQRQRVLTFLNPETDPLGAGYHTIQSQIAIGSGGIFGKGYMNGSQAQLEFLPERSTDFIFAVIGEEWGIVGCFVLMMLYMLVIGRGLYIANQAQDTFSRLIAGSLTLTFCGVRVRQQRHGRRLAARGRRAAALVSYGGTSLVTLMAGFGILMSIHSRRKLVSTWTKDSRRQVPRHLLALVACGGLSLLATHAGAQSLDMQRADIAAFIADVSQRQGFRSGSTDGPVCQGRITPGHPAGDRAAAEKALTWDEYRGKFLTERRIAGGRTGLPRTQRDARTRRRRLLACRPTSSWASSAWRRSTAPIRASTASWMRFRHSRSITRLAQSSSAVSSSNSCDDTRREARSPAAARVVRRGDGHTAVHADEFPQVGRGWGRRRAAQSVDRLGRRVCQCR
jgi:hypothetical protein